MLTKKSRYYGIKEVDTLKDTGELVTGLALRRNESVNKAIVHPMDSGDRLDHLAYQYYRDTLHWWRIADANPQMLSPLDLVNKSPVAEYGIQLRWRTPSPAWYQIKAKLSRISGIVAISLGTEEQKSPMRYVSSNSEEDNANNTALGNIPALYSQDLTTAVRTQQIGQNIISALQVLGLDLSAGYRIDSARPDVWQIEAFSNGLIYQLQLANNQIAVSQLVQEHHWYLQIKVNRYSDAIAQVRQQLESLNIDLLSEISLISKLGTELSIPTPKR